MEFTRFSLLALFCLALIRIDASQSGEDYWQSLWPNTPLPKALSDLLMPYSKIKVPIKAEEVKQYWTVFFEHDLYPGKKMNLGIHKHSDIHHSHSAARVPITKPSQPFGVIAWNEKESQPFEAQTLGTHEESNQPFGTKIWLEKENQPFGTKIWLEKERQRDGAQTLGTNEESSQPFGTKIWLEKESQELEKESQPFGTKIWLEKESQELEKESQPFGTKIWLETESQELEKESQPFGTKIWLEKESQELEKESQPFGTKIWLERESQELEKESQPFGTKIWLENEKQQLEKESQPIGTRTRGARKQLNQHFGTKIWLEKESKPLEAEIEETSEKVSQPFGTKIWLENERETLNQPFGVVISPKKEKQSFRAQTRGPKEDSIDDYCGNPSAIGENKYCALSLKSMMNFAISKLGKDIKVISSSFSPNQDQFVVEEVKKIGDEAVMCHRMNFEKVVFYCHQVNATTTYMVPLVASDGTKSMALTICHHDTRGMDPTMLYEILKVKPGTVPVCHFVGNKAVAWVPNRDLSESHDHPCVI